MCGDEIDAGEAELQTQTATELLFESYFDRDSGVWSLRRVPTIPPKPDVEER